MSEDAASYVTMRAVPGTERRKWPDDYLPDDAPDGYGIDCPKCGCKHWCVTHSRPATGGTIYRRRVCRNCGYVKTTYER